MVISKYALLDGSTVVNIISWDGDTETFDPAPLVAVPYDPAVHVLAVDPIMSNQVDLIGKVQSALTVNAAFLALGSPTNAQTLLQVQRLTREVTALIHFALDDFSDTSGT